MTYSIILTIAVIFLAWKVFEIQKNINSPQETISDREGRRGFERIFLPLRKVALFNFIGGMAWGLGAFLGATILVGILIIIFDLLGDIPFIGDIIENIFQQTDVINGI